jgi:FAD/FMN-containing dehydrogenase
VTPGETTGSWDNALEAKQEDFEAWGMNARCSAPASHPRTVGELNGALTAARNAGTSAGLRGAGCSYGDAALNTDGSIIDFRDWNRILSFDEQTGVMVAEPGVTIGQVWQEALPHGWWPPVVPGTMFPTLGGCLAMNIHGKNNFQAGTIGRHVRSFDLMLADGTVKTCSKGANEELFHAAIGSFGMLGAFTRIELQLKQVHSGNLEVQGAACADLTEMIAHFEEHWETCDYLVGWIDAFGGGRGLIHQAWYPGQGVDTNTAATLQRSHQELPPRLFGFIPRSWMWCGMWCFLHKPGMRFVNAIKYRLGRRQANRARHRQSLVGFSFLLDYVPHWKYAYKPGSFIQYQVFVPKRNAVATFEAQLRLCKEHGIIPFLGVLKKHLPDPFLMTHAVDGYSLALDLPLARGGRNRLWKLAHAMDEVVLDAGGRFYLAKDSTLTSEGFKTAYPAENLSRFLELKRELDPDDLFQTDLSRRLLEPLG